MKMLKALITAGATREPIDDVRFITNFSRGSFGATIARALVKAGVETTLLGSRDLLRQTDWLCPQLKLVEYRSFSDLKQQLYRLIETEPPDLLFMTAAVSDYSPVRREGKIRSTEDELLLRLKRNPKLLRQLREKCGVATFIVGFKLLSGVSSEELLQTGRIQIKRDRLNLTVANDLDEIAPEYHPIVMLTPEGGAIRRKGDKQTVAGDLVAFVLERFDVKWSRSVRVGITPTACDAHEAAAELLTFAQGAQLLPGTDGNVSVRTADGGLWITPRQVPKKDLKPDELVHVHWECESRTVRYGGERKPSIDSSVHAWLYNQLPRLNGLIHFHEAIVLPTAVTCFPFPCGSLEEGQEVYQALAAAAAVGDYDGGDFSVELVDHGFLLGLVETDAKSLAQKWRQAVSRYHAHLDDIGESHTIDDVSLCPIFRAAEIIGVLASWPTNVFAELTVPDGAGVDRVLSVFLLEEARSKGIGDDVLHALKRHPHLVVAHDDCAVTDFYVHRGYQLIGQRPPMNLLLPPALRDDLISAASVCLVDAVRKEILLGRRLQPPWPEYWAFPGGHVEPGETDIDAAKRELFEETGLTVPSTQPFLTTTVRVSSRTGAAAFTVTNFAFFVLDSPEPRISDELDARWFPLAEAHTVKPMAAGTRRILQRLNRRLRSTHLT